MSGWLSSRKHGSKHPWYAATVGVLKYWTVVKPLSCVVGTLVAALFVFTWSRDDLSASLNNVNFSEDKHLARFADHCVAPADGVEGTLRHDLTGRFRLHSVIVFFAHGDSSAILPWPGEAPGVFWDCSPQALPRYWRLNKRVEFPVVGSNGERLERSFTPEFAHQQLNSPSSPYMCAPGQLTSTGFRQAVYLGRHLAQAYDAHLGHIFASGPSLLVVHSLDTKRSLASAVGLLMALLAAPEVISLVTSGMEVPIQIQPNLSSGDQYTENMELGNHLLARWCHQLPWPCESNMLGGPQCISVEGAAELVSKSEVDTCKSLPAGTRAWDPLLLAEVERLFQVQNGSFTLVSTEGRALTGALKAFIGAVVCGDPLTARPPSTSHLAIERWVDPADGFRWRFLWNGQDISAKIVGCSGQETLGCSEAAIKALLSAH